MTTAAQDAIFYGGLILLFALRVVLVRRMVKKAAPSDPLRAKLSELKKWSKP